MSDRNHNHKQLLKQLMVIVRAIKAYHTPGMMLCAMHVQSGEGVPMYIPLSEFQQCPPYPRKCTITRHI